MRAVKIWSQCSSLSRIASPKVRQLHTPRSRIRQWWLDLQVAMNSPEIFLQKNPTDYAVLDYKRNCIFVIDRRIRNHLDLIKISARINWDENGESYRTVICIAIRMRGLKWNRAARSDYLPLFQTPILKASRWNFGEEKINAGTQRLFCLLGEGLSSPHAT